MTCGFCKTACNNSWCSTKKLSPCPICKGKAHLITLPNGKYVIRCEDCKISSMQIADRERLIKEWEGVPK